VPDRACCTPRCTGLPETARADAELAELVAEWPTLPTAVQASILAMIRASASGPSRADADGKVGEP